MTNPQKITPRLQQEWETLESKIIELCAEEDIHITERRGTVIAPRDFAKMLFLKLGEK